MSESEIKTDNGIEQVRAHFLSLFDLPPEEYQEAAMAFVRDRRESLEKTAADGYVISLGGGNFQGYIGPDALISPQGMGKDYKLDDPTIYDHIAPLLYTTYHKIFEKVGGDPVRAYLNAAIRTAQYTQQVYFGSVAGNVKKRWQLLGDILDDDTEVKSITDLKSVAVCSERAAVANNVLQILGFNPVLETGQLDAEGTPQPEAHVFLFIQGSNGEEHLYDPTNPQPYYDSEGNLLETAPALYPAGNALSMRSEPVTGQHKTYRIQQDGSVEVTEIRNMKFTLSPNGTELHPY